MLNKKLIIFIFGILFISVVCALPQDEGSPINHRINYSNIIINETANDTEHFQGYTPTTLRDWFETYFNGIYCLLTGCNMTGNLNTTGTFQALEVCDGSGNCLNNLSTGGGGTNTTHEIIRATACTGADGQTGRVCTLTESDPVTIIGVDIDGFGIDRYTADNSAKTITTSNVQPIYDSQNVTVVFNK